MEVGGNIGSNDYKQQNFNNQQNYIPQNNNRNNTPSINSNGFFIGVIIALGVLIIILFVVFYQ